MKGSDKMKAKTYDRDNNLMSGNLFINIIKVALPLMLSGILQLFYNAADLIVCGQFGSDKSVGAISSTNSLINLIIGLFMGLSVGASVLMSRTYGAQDKEKAYRITHTAILLSIVIGVILGIFGMIFNRYFLIMMKSPTDVIDLSSQYLFIYFMGLPFSMIYNFGSALLRSIGETKKPFYYLTFAGIINVLLNLFLVIVLKLDVAGVAIATIVSQGISAILVINNLVKSNGYCMLNLKELKIYNLEMKEIIKIGLPAGFQSILFSLSNVLIQSSINSLGASVMNGSGAAQSLEGFGYVTMNSVAQTCVTFVGASYGANNKENINKSLKYSSFLIITIGLIVGLILMIFSRPLLSLYVSDPLDINYGYERMKIIVLTYFLCGLMDAYALSIRALGYSILPTIVSLLGVCGMRVLWVYTIFKIPAYHTIQSLAISYPISWLITGLIQFVILLIVKRKVFKKM